MADLLPRRAHDIMRCEVPQRCCYLGDTDAPCPSDATLTIVDGDAREATYVCEQHRDAFAGEAFLIGSG